MARADETKKIDTLQSVELGDGVEILLRIAGPYVRSMALLIDYLIIIGVLIIGSILLAFTAFQVNTNIGGGFMNLMLFVMSWGYFAIFEGGKRGATIGKRAMGIRVVDRTGNNASRGQAFVRNILRFVDMLPGLPTSKIGFFFGGYGTGLTTSLLSKKFQRLGDLVANTVVVYSKPVKPVQATVPPALEKVTPPVALTREEQAAIASYKERAGLWSEARRIELAEHAAAVTGAYGPEAMQKILGMADWLSERK